MNGNKGVILKTKTINFPELSLKPTIVSTALKIAEEAGELAATIGKHRGMNGEEPDAEWLPKLVTELLDVAQTSVTMMIILEKQYGIDLDSALKNHIQKLIKKEYIKSVNLENPIECPHCGAGHDDIESLIPINVNCSINKDGTTGEIILNNEEIYNRVHKTADSINSIEYACNVCGENFTVMKGLVESESARDGEDKDFDVHFAITGFYNISGNSKEDAAEKANDILNNVMDDIEGKLHTGVKDDNYVVEVIEKE